MGFDQGEFELEADDIIDEMNDIATKESNGWWYPLAIRSATEGCFCGSCWDYEKGPEIISRDNQLVCCDCKLGLESGTIVLDVIENGYACFDCLERNHG